MSHQKFDNKRLEKHCMTFGTQPNLVQCILCKTHSKPVHAQKITESDASSIRTCTCTIVVHENTWGKSPFLYLLKEVEIHERGGCLVQMNHCHQNLWSFLSLISSCFIFKNHCLPFFTFQLKLRYVFWVYIHFFSTWFHNTGAILHFLSLLIDMLKTHFESNSFEPT